MEVSDLQITVVDEALVVFRDAAAHTVEGHGDEFSPIRIKRVNILQNLALFKRRVPIPNFGIPVNFYMPTILILHTL